MLPLNNAPISPVKRQSLYMYQATTFQPQKQPIRIWIGWTWATIRQSIQKGNPQSTSSYIDIYPQKGRRYIFKLKQIKTQHRPSCYLPYSRPAPGQHLSQIVIPKDSHRPHTCREGTKHWSLTIYPRTPCGRNENMATPLARHCLHILPGRCNKPTHNNNNKRPVTQKPSWGELLPEEYWHQCLLMGPNRLNITAPHYPSMKIGVSLVIYSENSFQFSD